MDRLELSGQPPGYAAYREPPTRKRNTLRAVLIIVSSCLLSGLIFFGCFLYYQNTYTSPAPAKTQTIAKGVDVPYPPTKQAVAREFGGRPSSWHKVGASGWQYDGNQPIAFTLGKNARMWTFRAGLHWPVADAQK
jgi:hypothetical protein